MYCRLKPGFIQPTCHWTRMTGKLQRSHWAHCRMRRERTRYREKAPLCTDWLPPFSSPFINTNGLLWGAMMSHTATNCKTQTFLFCTSVSLNVKLRKKLIHLILKPSYWAQKLNPLRFYLCLVIQLKRSPKQGKSSFRSLQLEQNVPLISINFPLFLVQRQVHFVDKKQKKKSLTGFNISLLYPKWVYTCR